MKIPLANTVKGIRRERKVERKKGMKSNRREGRGRLEGAIKAERRMDKWIQKV